MTSLVALVDHPQARTLAWTLVHFLWQGAAIGLLVWAVGRFGRLSASSRYLVGVGALATMFLAPFLTFAALSRQGTVPSFSSASSREIVGDSLAGSPGEISAVAALATVPNVPGLAFEDVARYGPGTVLVLWSLGVCALALRLAGGWALTLRLSRRGTKPVAPDIAVIARRVAARLALSRIVQCFESAAVAVPVTVGWVKPVILFPASAMSGLSLAQIEALLAHELAHVRRNDYLVNLLQSAVETLLFYHPAVWWVSRRVRIDREHCCDDIAVGVCDRLVYATALSDLAAMSVPPRLALAATDGPLLSRVRRILGKPDGTVASRAGWAPGFLVLLVTGALGPALVASQPQRAVPVAVPASQVVDEAPVSVPMTATTVVDAERSIQAVVPVHAQQAHVVVALPTPTRALHRQFMGWHPVAVQGRDAARVSQARATEEELKALLAQLTQLDREQLQLERKRWDLESQEQIRDLLAQLDQKRAEQERVKQQVEQGNVSESTLREVAAALAQAERALSAATARQKLDEEELLLKVKMLLAQRDEARQHVEMTRLRAAAEAELVDQRARQELAEQRARLEDLRRTRDERHPEVQSHRARIAELERLMSADELQRQLPLERDLPARERAMRASDAVTDPAATIRATDVLVVSVANEPDLPKVFIVQSDGAIRFPLIGAIRVIGLTVEQARSAISREFRERKIDSAFDLSLRRPREVRRVR